jgi:hypothetical protein
VSKFELVISTKWVTNAQQSIVVLALSFALVSPILAEPRIQVGFITGAELYSWCRAERADRLAIACSSYIAGVADAIATRRSRHGARRRSLFCEPPGITLGRERMVVIRYLAQHPEEAPGDAATLILRAFREAFPCDSGLGRDRVLGERPASGK